MFPAKVKRSGYAAWSHEDARKILDGAKGYRNKALVHVLASTGCRLGAIPALKVEHVSEMPGGCKAILLYEGSNEEYYGFLTSEASKALDEYLERRKQDGEKVGMESPLFRLQYRIGSAKVYPLNMIALQATMVNIMRYARPKRHKIGVRYNIQLDHGFRKRFATIIKMDKKISWAVGEKLLGHKAYLDAEYFRPTKENLFAEFQKVIPDLTIDASERDKVTIQDLQQKSHHETELLLQSEKFIELGKYDLALHFIFNAALYHYMLIRTNLHLPPFPTATSIKAKHSDTYEISYDIEDLARSTLKAIDRLAMGEFYLRTLDLLKKSKLPYSLEIAYHWLSKLEPISGVTHDQAVEARTTIYNIILGIEHLITEKLIIDSPVVYGTYVEDVTEVSVKINYGFFCKLEINECAVRLYRDMKFSELERTVQIPKKSDYQRVVIDSLKPGTKYFCMIDVTQEGDPEYGGNKSLSKAEIKFETKKSS